MQRIRMLKKLMTASRLLLSGLVAAIARGNMDSREKSGQELGDLIGHLTTGKCRRPSPLVSRGLYDGKTERLY